MFYTLNWADKKTNKMQGKARRGKGRKGNRNVNGNWKLGNGKWKMVQRTHARWEVKVKRIKIGIKMALRSRPSWPLLLYHATRFMSGFVEEIQLIRNCCNINALLTIEAQVERAAAVADRRLEAGA